MTKRITSLILYQGPSMLDGSPIVVIATGIGNRSKNSKTGDMIQTHIIRADMKPMDAIWSGADSAICGDCVHRGDGTGKGRTCYVKVFQGTTVVYKSFARGAYPVATEADWELFRDRGIRLQQDTRPRSVTHKCTRHTLETRLRCRGIGLAHSTDARQARVTIMSGPGSRSTT